MSDEGPRILVGDDTFRIIRTVTGNDVHHVLEVPDGCDGLGVERWRDVRTDTRSIVTILMNYLIKRALKEEQADEHRVRVSE